MSNYLDYHNILYIHSDGKVGVNNNTPLATLSLASDQGNANGHDMIRMDSPDPAILFNDTTNTGSMSIRWQAGSGSSQGLRFFRDGDDGSNPELMIDLNGRIGIGTSNPSSILELAGDSSPEITFNDSTAGHRGSIEFQDGAFNFWSNYTASGQVAGHATNNLTILRGGNVGIGNTNPGANLNIGSSTSDSQWIRLSTQYGDFSIGNGSVNTPPKKYFSIYDNDVDLHRLWVSDSGNIGIDTTTPGARLHANESINGVNAGLLISNYNTTAGTGQQTRLLFGLARNSGSLKSTAGEIRVGKEQDWTNDDTKLDSYMAFNVYENMISNERLRITSNGKVGIGTTNPESLLTVAQTVGNDVTPSLLTLRTERSDVTTAAGPALQFVNNDSNNDPAAISRIKSISNNETVTVGDSNESSSHLVFETANAGVLSDKMVITGAGNVGIGTMVPSYKLTVIGGSSLRDGGQHYGNHEFAATTTSTAYNHAAIEIREQNYGTADANAPRLAFHWGGRVASQISIDTDAAITIRDNPGTGYEDLKAATIYSNGNRVLTTADDTSPTNYVKDDASDTLLGATYTFGSTTDQKIILGGSTNPYIKWREGSTDTAYMQWVASWDGILIHNTHSRYIDIRGTGNPTIRMRDTNANVRGMFYADTSNNVGILDAGGGWGVRVINDQGVELASDGHTAIFHAGADLVTGSYGTVETKGSGKGNWEGYSINGRAVFMHNGGNETGIYNDVNNHWMLKGINAGSTLLYYNGIEKIKTESSGVKVTGSLKRSAHHTGHLEGSYNNISANSAKTNPIYTIGSGYNPNDATLGNMYGIGFSSNSAATYFPSSIKNGSNGWGMYVAADGDARIFLNGTAGTIESTGHHYAGGHRCLTTNDEGSGKGLDADTLDGFHSGSFVQVGNNSSLNGDTRNTRGVTRLYRRDSNTDYSVQTEWDGSRWYLKGYTSDNFHAHCRVGYADSAGSAGNAGTLDSIDSSQFVRSDVDDTVTGLLSMSRSGECLRIRGSADTSSPYISFYQTGTRRAYIQFHDSTNTLRLFNDVYDEYLSIGNGAGGLKWNNGGTDYTVYHSGNLPAYPSVSSASQKIQDATGSYGSVKVTSTRNGYAGYAIQDDWVLMSASASICGLYNDTNNEWAMICRQNAEVELFHNGLLRLETNVSGISVFAGEGNEGAQINMKYNTSHANHVSIDIFKDATGQYDGSTSDWYWRVFDDTVSPVYQMLFNTRTGDFEVSGDVISFGDSDRMLKDNLKVIENPIDKLKQLNGYTFTWNEQSTKSGRHDVGVVAQEVEAVFPELVKTKLTGHKGVSYEKLTAVLIAGVNEQQQQIEQQQKQIDQLSKQIEQLIEQLDK